MGDERDVLVPAWSLALVFGAALVVTVLATLGVVVTWSQTAAAQAGPSLSITVIDPDGPDEPHVFRFINGPAPTVLTDGETASWQFAPETSVNVRAAQIPTNYYSALECDGGDFEVTLAGVQRVRGPMPYEDVHCTWTSDRSATITVNTSAPSDTSRTFIYRLKGRPFPLDLRDRTDGDSITVPVPVGVPLTIDSLDPFGWITSLSCVDDGGGAVIPGASTDAEFLLSSGTHAVCTFSHVQGHDLNLVVDDPDGPNVGHRFVVNGTTVTATDTQPAEVAIARFADVVVEDPDAVAFFSSVFCNHPNLTATQAGSITGTMPGGEVTCTFVVDRVTTVTLGQQALDDPDQVFTYAVTSALGTLMIDLAHDETVEVPIPTNAGPVTVSAVPLAGWSQTAVCEDDQGGATVDGASGDVDLALPRGAQATCSFTGSYAGPAIAFGVFPTVTCLAGNGRIDANVVNPDLVPHTYRLEVGALAPRQRTVAGQDWWRSPVTGRPDGPIAVRVLRDGAVIFDQMLTVACDANPAVSEPEVQILSVCRNGLGFIAWQFANPTDATRVYVIEFQGLPNRSTSAAPWGASVRGVSGRPDNTYTYAVRANGVIVLQDAVTVSCN